MTNQLLALIEQSAQKKDLYRPILFRLKNPTDKDNFQKLLENPAGLQVHDEIFVQVEELIKSKNPKTVYKKEKLQSEAYQFLSTVNAIEFGVWIYYPWNNKIVHILDEEDFVEIRTNRNQYKITPEEKAVLFRKKVGIIGLSVGQSIAMTIAMERTCGELRLVDFDKLELSNYNRIRTPLYNLDVPKVVAVAREIAEIDPYLKVTCYTQGLTEENMDTFFLEGGKMDLCVEVCDGLDIKILSRLRAKELGIPVVMNTSDRGSTDVERYDLNPNLSILHGLVDHLDLSKVKEAKTNEEKVPYIVPIIGLQTSSVRLKASMLEIGETINTWPQLASSVVLGGAIVTDLVRRIFLNQFTDSGRYFVDLEEIIRDKEIKIDVSNPKITNLDELGIFPLKEEDLLIIIKPFNSIKGNSQLNLEKSQLISIVKAGIQAPSAGNNQPWKMLYKDGILFLFHDQFYSHSFGDYKNIASYITMGSVIENVVLETHKIGLEVSTEVFPLGSDRRLVALFRFYNKIDSKRPEAHLVDELSDFIFDRFTNRNYSERKKIDTGVLGELTKVVKTVHGAEISFLQRTEDLKEIGEIIGASDRLRFLHPQAHYEFYQREIRWDQFQNEKLRDGLDIATLDLTPAEFTGLKISSDPEIVSFIRKLRGGKGFEKMSQKAVNSAGAIGLITMPKFDEFNFIEGGRAAERMWLMATKFNISIQPLFSPPLFFSRLIHGKSEGMPKVMKEELIYLRQKYIKLFPVSDDMAEVFLFRLSIANHPEVKSLRKPLDEVFYSR